jgi:hypothetical protein
MGAHGLPTDSSARYAPHAPIITSFRSAVALFRRRLSASLHRNTRTKHPLVNAQAAAPPWARQTFFEQIAEEVEVSMPDCVADGTWTPHTCRVDAVRVSCVPRCNSTGPPGIESNQFGCARLHVHLERIDGRARSRTYACARALIEEVRMDETASVSGTDSDGMVRISLSMDKKTRRLIRIAAAYADLEVGEWAANALREAAERETGADRGVSG